LWSIYSKTGSIQDIQRTVDVARYRLTLYPQGPGAWAGVANDLGYLLAELGRLTEKPEPLSEAVSVLKAGFEYRVDEKDKGLTAGNLCYAQVQLSRLAPTHVGAKSAVESCEFALGFDDSDNEIRSLLEQAHGLERTIESGDRAPVATD